MTRRATDPTSLARTITLPAQRQMSEAQLQAAVIELAGYLGYRHYHPLYSPGSDRGWPDLVLVSARQRCVIWAELKGAHGVVSADQQAWLDDLRAAGCEAYVWRPADWHSGEIDRILRGEST